MNLPTAHFTRHCLSGLTAGALILLASCARLGPPPGGLEDKEPPAVISFIPAADTTGVPLETAIGVAFSENVQRQSAEPLIKLSPEAGRLFFKWKDKSVGIRPALPLRPHITYRLSVAPGLTDMHRVQSHKTYESYFSTGLMFSPGKIGGTVRIEDSLGIGVVLKVIAAEDTSLVFQTASDSSGLYRFPYLPLGDYRLEAFRDLNRNGRLDFTREEGWDTLVKLELEPLKLDLALLLADTTAPLLKAVETPDSLTIVLEFDDRCDTVRGLSGAVFTLRTPDSLGAALEISSARLDSTNSRKVILKPAAPLLLDAKYFITADGVVNRAGLASTAARASKSFSFRPQESRGGKRR